MSLIEEGDLFIYSASARYIVKSLHEVDLSKLIDGCMDTGYLLDVGRCTRHNQNSRPYANNDDPQDKMLILLPTPLSKDLDIKSIEGVTINKKDFFKLIKRLDDSAKTRVKNVFGTNSKRSFTFLSRFVNKLLLRHPPGILKIISEGIITSKIQQQQQSLQSSSVQIQQLSQYSQQQQQGYQQHSPQCIKLSYFLHTQILNILYNDVDESRLRSDNIKLYGLVCWKWFDILASIRLNTFGYSINYSLKHPKYNVYGLQRKIGGDGDKQYFPQQNTISLIILRGLKINMYESQFNKLYQPVYSLADLLSSTTTIRVHVETKEVAQWFSYLFSSLKQPLETFNISLGYDDNLPTLAEILEYIGDNNHWKLDGLKSLEINMLKEDVTALDMIKKYGNQLECLELSGTMSIGLVDRIVDYLEEKKSIIPLQSLTIDSTDPSVMNASKVNAIMDKILKAYPQIKTLDIAAFHKLYTSTLKLATNLQTFQGFIPITAANAPILPHLQPESLHLCTPKEEENDDLDLSVKKLEFNPKLRNLSLNLYTKSLQFDYFLTFSPFKAISQQITSLYIYITPSVIYDVEIATIVSQLTQLRHLTINNNTEKQETPKLTKLFTQSIVDHPNLCTLSLEQRVQNYQFKLIEYCLKNGSLYKMKFKIYSAVLSGFQNLVKSAAVSDKYKMIKDDENENFIPVTFIQI